MNAMLGIFHLFNRPLRHDVTTRLKNDELDYTIGGMTGERTYKGRHKRLARFCGLHILLTHLCLNFNEVLFELLHREGKAEESGERKVAGKSEG